MTGLGFRQGTHELFSCALDRTVKTWNIDDRTYIDTLFGHQVRLALSLLVFRVLVPSRTMQHARQAWQIHPRASIRLSLECHAACGPKARNSAGAWIQKNILAQQLLPSVHVVACMTSMRSQERPDHSQACHLRRGPPGPAMQAEVLALDVLRAERALSTGHDHTCRVWKIADESQLICRAAGMALDCCRFVGRSFPGNPVWHPP